jgi:hypothetical protein
MRLYFVVVETSHNLKNLNSVVGEEHVQRILCNYRITVTHILISGAALLSTLSRILLPEKKGERKVDGNPRFMTRTTNLAIGQT